MLLQPSRESSDTAEPRGAFWHVYLSRTSTEYLLDDFIGNFGGWQDEGLGCDERRLPIFHEGRLSPHGMHDGGLNTSTIGTITVLEFLVEACGKGMLSARPPKHQGAH